MEHRAYNIQTWLNYQYKKHVYKPDGVSVAIPEMSYSLKELVEKFTLGTLPVDVVRDVMYTDNPDFDDFIATEYGDFDLTDYTREVNKLRELHNLRMERRKAVKRSDISDSEPTSNDSLKSSESSNLS